MGLYPVNCSQCGKTHQWFSGIRDQRCEECKNMTQPQPERSAGATEGSPTPEALRAAEEYAQEIPKHKVGTPGRGLAEARYAGFLAGWAARAAQAAGELAGLKKEHAIWEKHSLVQLVKERDLLKAELAECIQRGWRYRRRYHTNKKLKIHAMAQRHELRKERDLLIEALDAISKSPQLDMGTRRFAQGALAAVGNSGGEKG